MELYQFSLSYRKKPNKEHKTKKRLSDFDSLDSNFLTVRGILSLEETQLNLFNDSTLKKSDDVTLIGLLYNNLNFVPILGFDIPDSYTYLDILYKSPLDNKLTFISVRKLFHSTDFSGIYTGCSRKIPLEYQEFFPLDQKDFSLEYIMNHLNDVKEHFDKLENAVVTLTKEL